MDDNTQPQLNAVPNRGGIPITNYAPPTSSSTDATQNVQADPPVAAVQHSASVKEEQKTEQDKNAIQTGTAQPEPVSAPRSKEHEPIAAPFPDVAKMSEAQVHEEEIKVEQEIESWIEKLPASEKPKIPEEAKKAGLEHAKADTPMPAVPAGVAALPMSYAEAELIREKGKHQWHHWRRSVEWLATLIMYHWKKIKITTVENKEE